MLDAGGFPLRVDVADVGRPPPAVHRPPCAEVEAFSPATAAAAVFLPGRDGSEKTVTKQSARYTTVSHQR